MNAAEPGAGPSGFGAGAQSEATPAASDAGGGESPLSVATENLFSPDRPEVMVGAAFAGGFLLAKVLKRLGRG